MPKSPLKKSADPRPARARWLAKPPTLLCLELFVAIALSVNFFYLVKTECLPKQRTGNMLSTVTFCWLSENMNLSAKDLPPAWRTRVLAPAMSSWLTQTKFDYPIDFQSTRCKNLLDVCNSPDFQQLFGLYHAGWLFLTFLVLIVFRRDALLLILAVFAGLMYNLLPSAGMYYYPWDMPTLLFFTLACLLFDRGWIWPLLPVVLLGGLVKETTLCCALFILLGSHWNWPKRILGFLIVVAATFAVNRLLMAHYAVQAPLFAMNNADTVRDLFRHTLLDQNLPVLFSLDLNHVAFANAGALLVMMLIPWHNWRDVVFKLVIVVFVIGQFLYGYVIEFRVWYELLPLGWIIVSEAVTRQWGMLQKGTAASSAAGDRASRMWKGSYWLTMSTLLALALAVFVVVKLTVPAAQADTRSQDAILHAEIAAAQTGDVGAQYELGQAYKRDQNYDEAMRWYQKAAEAGNVNAQYALAMLFAGVRRDYTEAEKWLRLAAAQGHPAAEYSLGAAYWSGMASRQDYDEGLKWVVQASFHGYGPAQLFLGQIYENPPRDPPNLVEAYKWLKVAQINGVNLAGQELKTCAAKMTAEQIAEAEAWVKQRAAESKRTGP